MADSYILRVTKPGSSTFTMPAGFTDSVEIHVWGAGGGKGRGGNRGGPGGYAYTLATMAEGDTIEVVVGGAGGNASGNTGGAAGQGASDGRFRGGKSGNSSDEDGDTGCGGGGGGASAVLINNSIIAVGAGGGGSGGYGDDSSGGAIGLAGGVFPGQATNVYAVTYYTWSSLLQNYGIWGGGQVYTAVLNFPTSGTYTFRYSVDNNGSISLDGTPVITRTGELNWGSIYTQTVSVSAGLHTVVVTGVNISGPAGVAAQILKPDSTELWNTRDLLFSDGVTDNTIGGSSPNGGSTGGGGGGGYRGGEAGATYGDDRGNPPPGNGGQNLGQVTLISTDASAPGRATTYYPKNSSGTALDVFGAAGTQGYVVLVFTRKSQLKIKDDGSWKNIDVVYVKTNEPDRTTTTNFNQRYTTSGVYIVPSGVTSLTVEASGGGGGGGGYHSGCGGATRHPGGNGGAGYKVNRTIAVTPGQAVTWTIGAAGVGGAASVNGTAGGTTTVSGVVSITAAGGGGGIQGTGNGPGASAVGGNGSAGGLGGQNRDTDPAGNNGVVGYVNISYTSTTTITRWRPVNRIWVKDRGVWKEITSTSQILLS